MDMRRPPLILLLFGGERDSNPLPVERPPHSHQGQPVATYSIVGDDEIIIARFRPTRLGLGTLHKYNCDSLSF